jgi:Carboxypeptidase regulatory-like domain/TonB dependent receptor
MKTTRGFLVVLILLVTAAMCWAQSSQGRISGRVTDQTGAVVAKATVTIRNAETGVKRVLETNAAGEYFAPNLPAGLYAITVEAPSFKKLERSAFRLEVATDVRQDFELQAGAASEIVDVRDEAPLVESTTTTLSGVLANKAINELPLQGRDFQNLLALHPGVQRTPGGGFHSVTSNGNRPDDNNFIIDGATDTDAYWGETVVGDAGVQGTPASHLPLDAIQEFNTQENPQADYGAKPGVVVNVGLRSGTNDIHGTAYYFHRNAALDARNYLNPRPQPLSALLLHQFGASIGGPIQKDKWFYFVNYEGARHKVGNPFNAASPVTTSLVGATLPEDTVPEDWSIFDAQAAAGCPDDPSCNPLSYKISKLLLPNPGFTASATDPSLINFNFNNFNREDNVIAKTDFHANQHHIFSGRYIYANALQTEEDAIPLRPEWLSQADVHTQVMGIDWTWTPNSKWTNQARFSYNRFSETIFPADHTKNPATDYGIDTGITNPDLFGFPRINPDRNTFDYMGGNSTWPLFTKPSRTESFSDTASYTSGKHSIRFGGNFSHGGVNYLRGINGRGRVDFSSLTRFVAGRPRSGRLLVGDLQRNVSLDSFGLFVQDDFRVRPHVTLNLGLRYDVVFPIKEDHNLLANYVPDQGVVQVGKGISEPYATKYNNISPRLGVAWDVFGTGKTVLRAGGGIIFTQPSIRTFVNSAGLNYNPSGVPGVSPGNGTINTFLRFLSGSDVNWTGTGPVFDLGADASNCSSDPADDAACDVFGVDRHIKTPYVANWTLNLQQQLTPNTMLQIAYVGNRGIKLYSNLDINQSDTALSSQCVAENGGYFDADFTFCEQAARPLTTNCTAGTAPCQPFIGFLTFLGNRSSSNYHSLQATLTKRYTNGIYLLAGYTWAHAIDTATSNLASVPPNSLNYNADRGNGDYDIRHRFTLALTYDLPARKVPFQLLEGWQLTSLLTLESGEPYTLDDSSNDISITGELNDRWNMYGSADNVRWQRPDSSIPYFVDGTSNPRCLATATTPELLDSLANFGCYEQNGTIIVPPALGTFGNMGRNIFRGPSFVNWDASITKAFKLSERVAVQLRGEFFNVLNHPNFDVFTLGTNLSSGTVGNARATPDVGVANPVVGSGGSRHIQLGVKLIW